jgi:tetratricopeptide (TPR) repeat protein
MKTAPLVLLMLLVVAPVDAQSGTDTKAKLAGAVAAAQKAFDAGNFEQAEDALKAAASAVHDDFGAVLLRAKANFELGEFGKAVTYAERAAELDEKNFDARFLAGRSKYQQAEALRASPLNSGTRVNGFFEGALVDFEKASKLRPDAADLRGWMANCLFALDRVPEAVKLYEELRKAKPDDPELCLRIARMHFQAGNHEAALKAATDGLVTKGASGIRGDLAQVVFEILNKAQKHAEMYAAFKAWSTTHPNDPQAYLWMGYTRFLEKNLDEAISLYQKGFDVSGKKHAGLALELGNSYAEKSNGLAKDEHEKTVMKAAEAYGAALKAQAEWPNYEAGPIWKLLGLSGSFAMKVDYAKAIEVLEKYALPAADGDWNVNNNLGLFYRDWADRIDRSHKSSDARAKNEKSLAYYLKASKAVLASETATPKNKAQVLNDTGVIYDYQLGNMEKGLDYYRQALQHDATYIDALENLALCFNKLGKYEEAIPLFQKVLEQDGGRAVSRRGMSEAKKAVDKDQKPASR